MEIEIVTKEDLNRFRVDIINEIKNLLKPNEQANWLKSSEVKQILACSDSTLQKHRNSGRLHFTKVGGTYYYSLTDINKMMSISKISYN